MTAQPIALREPGPARPLHALDSAHAHRLDGGGWRVVATKRIDAGDPYLRGHFPDVTVFPGVFVIECLRQAVAECVAPDVRVVSVGSARFLAPLMPGDDLHLDALVEAGRGGLAVSASAVNQDGRRVAKVRIVLEERDA